MVRVNTRRSLDQHLAWGQQLISVDIMMMNIIQIFGKL